MSLEKLFIKRDCTPSLMKPAIALTRHVSRSVVATVSAGVETDWQQCVASHPALASSSSNFS